MMSNQAGVAMPALNEAMPMKKKKSVRVSVGAVSAKAQIESAMSK